MLVPALIVIAGVVVGKMAAIEDRNALLWGTCAVGAGFVGLQVLGVWGLAAPALTLVGGFVALWVARSRDEDRGRGGRRIG